MVGAAWKQPVLLEQLCLISVSILRKKLRLLLFLHSRSRDQIVYSRSYSITSGENFVCIRSYTLAPRKNLISSIYFILATEKTSFFLLSHSRS